MTPVPSMPVVAMAAPPDGAAPIWIQLVPFAAILAIFYFIILLPMKRRQKKVAEFQAALKTGDKVVTTSGIYGVITKLDDLTVTLQVGHVHHVATHGEILEFLQHGSALLD